MKASIEKVQKGLTAFLDNEISNHLEGWAKIGFGAGAALAIRNLPKTVELYAKSPAVAMLGVIDTDGNVDIDALHDAVIDHFTSDGEYMNIPLAGRVKVCKQDIEALYNYIKEA